MRVVLCLFAFSYVFAFTLNYCVGFTNYTFFFEFSFSAYESKVRMRVFVCINFLITFLVCVCICFPETTLVSPLFLPFFIERWLVTVT